MSYSLTTIWHERQRFLPAILAVAFSAVLVTVQTGLVLGLLSMMSIPVDKATADVWVGYPGIRSVDLGRPIPRRWLVRVAAHPEVERVEAAILAFSLWTRPGQTPATSRSEVCTIVGTRLDSQSLAASEAIRSSQETLAQLQNLERLSSMNRRSAGWEFVELEIMPKSTAFAFAWLG